MTVIVSAGVIWRPDGRLLLTQRLKGAHLGGMWEFPGGKVEPDEDPIFALVRECQEECAIDVEVDSILDVAFHRFPEKSVLLLFFDARLKPFVTTDPVVDRGVGAHVWVTPAELDGYPLPPPDVPLVRKLQARGGPPAALSVVPPAGS